MVSQYRLNTSKASFEQAQRLQAQGHLEEALREYRSILDVEGDRIYIWHQVAHILESQGKFAEVIESYRKAIELDANSPAWVYRHLGFALHQQQRSEEAVEAYQKAISLQPDDVDAYRLLGQAQGKLRDFDGAIASYQKAIKLSAEVPIWVYLNLGAALSQKGRGEEAISAYEKALELEPENSGIQQLLEGVIARKEAHEGDRCQRAKQLQREGLLDEALAEFRAVLEVDGSNLVALHQVAQICETQGKWDEAVEGYRKAIEVDAAPPYWISRHLGFALSQRGNWDEAIEAYEKAIVLNPEDGATQSLLEYISKKKTSRDAFIDIDENFEILEIEPDEEEILPTQTYDDPVVDAISKEFDREFYLSTNLDVKEAGVDPVYHYYHTWSAEYRNPAPWFNTKYYLEANPDIKESNVNPFWHYLVAGRAEGRFPQKPGGYRRQIIETLSPASERTKHYNYPDTVFKISFSHLLAVFQKSCTHTQGIVAALSHDCYIKGVGGTQIFISDEQKKFNENQYAYLHISPVMSKLALADENLDISWIQLVLNGEYIGVTTYDDLGKALSETTSNLHLDRILVVHCILGHQISGIIKLKEALGATNSYFWLHDYSSLCVGFNLLRNDITYCGAPNSHSLACRVCIYGKERLSHLEEMRRLFTAINFQVIAPSKFTLDLWQKSSSLPHLSAIVHEHCKVEMTAHKVAASSTVLRGTQDNPLRIAYIGYPVHHKGWQIFLNLLAQTRKLPYKFYHFASEGALQSISDVENISISVTSKSRNEMIEALSEKTIDIALILSPWPETFSYATYEAFASGAAVIALLDSGNVAAAVRKTGRGIIVKDEEDLIKCFRSNRVIKYAQKRCAEGIEVGSLAHIGTTASLIFSNKD